MSEAVRKHRPAKQNAHATQSQGAQELLNVAPVSIQKVEADGVNVFYRAAGDASAPVILLLHGFPTSSFMFRELIPRLADAYHVVAPDYLGFGLSDAPPATQFTYSFDALAASVADLLKELGIQRY